MSNHPFDNSFELTQEQKQQFQRDGFVKLKGFLNPDVVSALLERIELEMNSGIPSYFKVDPQFYRAKYDFETAKDNVYQLLERSYFAKTLTELAGRDLFLTFELCFELEKNISRGFPWHVGIQSFGYQVAEEFGCTVWAPLHPVDVEGQRGGMAYVPQHVISGDFIYRQFEPAIVSALERKEKAGNRTSVKQYFEMRNAVLNSPAISEILELHQVEDNFQPGDALLFNKYVVHRSVMLGEGVLPRRAAYVMRFIDAGSHYDLQRAENLELPSRLYGKGLLPYKPITRQHIEIAEAGVQDGAILSECAYFDNRDRRLIQCKRQNA